MVSKYVDDKYELCGKDVGFYSLYGAAGIYVVDTDIVTQNDKNEFVIMIIDAAKNFKSKILIIKNREDKLNLILE
jgi:hypothetical protein